MSATRRQEPERIGLTHLAATVRRMPPLRTFMRAIERAGLEPTLARLAPLTVFAPADSAFALLPDGTVTSLLDDPVALNQVLTYHLSPGLTPSGRITGPGSVPTINGESLPLSVDGAVHVDGAIVIGPDIPAANGIIHIIDRVLLPAMM